MMPYSRIDRFFAASASFLCSLAHLDLLAITPKDLEEAISRKKPLSIVTLTRITTNDKQEAVPEQCLPISAAEAVTLFAIAHALLEGPTIDLSDKIKAAYEFDKKQFARIKEAFNTEEKIHSASVLALQQDLEETESAKAVALVSFYKDNKKFPLLKITHSNQGGHIQLNTNDKEIASLSIGARKTAKLSGATLKDACFFLMINEGEIKIENKDIKKALEAMKFFQKRESNKEKYLQELKRRCLDYFLSGYLVMEEFSLEHYIELYRRSREKFKCSKKDHPCILVANELFFGKNFILPNSYPGLVSKFFE